MKQLLTLKHWQMFALLIGVPLILQFALLGSMIANKNVSTLFAVFPALIAISVLIFFGWFYALGTNLYEKLPPTAPMKLGLFKTAIIIPTAYILILSVLMFGMFTKVTAGFKPNLAIFAVIVPLHLIAMACIFYCLYFNAKALKAVELQRPVQFGDYIGEFFLLWYLPIGIWIIQPRLNRLFGSGEMSMAASINL